ncbi:MAG TPA: SMC family ATPase, partial [Thermoplasmatales archaeon]|nr:SMC family ATPase [Thermoplasmatales archaeon]HEX17474.1 SMC family ATPase [Thermoplasmatales archaeon]
RQIELERLKEERNEMEAEIRLIDQRIKEYGERIDELRKMREKMEDEKKKLTLLNTLEKIMGEFRMDMISRIRPTLSAYASSLMEILTEGKYSQVELNENYDIMIYDGGKAYEIGRFSGGEEDLANLCIRLSISQMLADRAGGEFNMIILDEIFGSQDVNRRRNILNTLTSLSSRFRQIFVVTHIEEIKQMVDNAIIVYEDEDGSSRIKVE